jgi:hypothetical protein
MRTKYAKERLATMLCVYGVAYPLAYMGQVVPLPGPLKSLLIR